MATHKGRLPALLIVALVVWPCALLAVKAKPVPQRSDDEFGPVVRAYLGYLRNEQEVVDDRVSRREVSPAYYRHNSNRIKALRQIAIRLARESNNDYLPELALEYLNVAEKKFDDETPVQWKQPVGIERGRRLLAGAGEADQAGLEPNSGALDAAAGSLPNS